VFSRLVFATNKMSARHKGVLAARSDLRRAMSACEKHILYFDCHYVYFGSDYTRSILKDSDPVVVALPALQGYPIRIPVILVIITFGSFVSFSMFTSSFIFIDKKPPVGELVLAIILFFLMCYPFPPPVIHAFLITDLLSDWAITALRQCKTHVKATGVCPWKQNTVGSDCLPLIILLTLRSARRSLNGL